MECSGCGNPVAYAIKSILFNGQMQDFCDKCGGVTSIANVPDCYVPPGGMHFEHLSHPDYPESYGGTFCASKAEKSYYLKKYGLAESGDRIHGTNHYDPLAARHARESLNKRRNLNG
jgi:hypothetical protein